MKKNKLILAVFLILIFQFSVLAQQETDLCGEQIKKIITKPDIALNEEWNAWFPNDIGSYVNSFEWGPYPGNQVFIPFVNMQWHPNFTNASSSNPNYIMMNNPFSINNTQLGYLYQSPKQQVSTIPAMERDWHWEDGWELMYLNIGELPNGTRIDEHTNSMQYWNVNVEKPVPGEVPYIVLYNRYTGLLRVFFSSWSDPSVSWDEVTVSLFFTDNSVKNDKISGIFRHANGLDVPLTEKSNVVKLQTPRQQKVGTEYSQWFAAEFQLGYDVCQCQFASQMQLIFETSDVLEADLITRSMSIEKKINTLSDEDLHYFQSMTYMDDNGNIQYAVPGNLIFKDLQELSSSYQREMDKYKDLLNDHNNSYNQLKSIILELGLSGMVNGLASITVPPTKQLRDFILKNQMSLYDDIVLLPQDTSEATAWAGQIESTAKKIIAGQTDFFSSMFGIVEEPTAPSMPVATFSEGRINGKIINSNTNYSVLLNVPGALKSQPDPSIISSFNYPIYNQLTGLFALLEKPELRYFDEGNTCTFAAFNEWDSTYVFNRSERYFQVSDNIKYALNPVLDFDLDKTKILGALVVELKYPQSYYPFNTEFLWDTYLSSNFTVTHSFIDVNGIVTTQLTSNYYDLKTINNLILKLDHVHRLIIHDVDFGELGSVLCKTIEPIISNIKFKVAADMYFNQIGSNNEQVNTFQVFTYELYNESVHEPLSSGNTNAAIRTMPDISWVNYSTGTVLLDDIVQPTDGEVWEVIGNKIYVKAEHVKIENIVGPAEGYELIIQAIETTMEPDAELKQGTEIIPTWFQFYPKSNPIMSPSELPENYCGGIYDGNEIIAQKRNPNGAGNIGLKISNDEIESIVLSIYPNPVNDVVNVKVTEGELGSCSVKVMSVTGITLINERVSDDLLNGFAIGVEHLVNGYYILELFSDDGYRVQKKFVVQH